MAVNPDPRPGRWLLPLVVLAMVLFTYVFVQSLPSAEPDQQDLSEDATTTSTTTTTTSGTGGEDTTTTTTAALDPEVEAYLGSLADAETELTGYQAEMAAINNQWDADPKEIDFATAEASLEDLAGRISVWAEDVAALPAPDSLSESQGLVTSTAEAAADAAAEVLAGLRAPDTGEARRAALEQFDLAVRGFTAAVDDAGQRALATTGG